MGSRDKTRGVVVAIGFALLLSVAATKGATAGAATCFGETATKVGTKGRDTIRGTAGPDVIFAGGGNDRVLGRGGDDLICGASGTDVLLGGGGNDKISTANGGDEVKAGPGNDELRGGSRHGDYLDGGPGDDLIDGGTDPYDLAEYELAPGPVNVDLAAGTATGNGTDTLIGIEAATGSNYADVLTGNELDNRFYGWDGNDTISAAGGNDFLTGGSGDDDINGGEGTDYLTYYTADAAVTVDLQQGSATGEGNDTLSGIEDLDGSYYADVLTGDAGPNNITGDDSNDQISGGAGNDTLRGDDGNDTVDGGPGNDSCVGESKSNCET